MASNSFDRLMDLNAGMIRDANRKKRQQDTTRKTWEQTQRNTDRATAFKDRDLERRRYEEARRAPILERYYNRGHLQGVASGRKDPRQAMLGMSPTPDALAMARPEIFGAMGQGAGAKSGSKSSGTEGGFSANQFAGLNQKALERVDARMEPSISGPHPLQNEKGKWVDSQGSPMAENQMRQHLFQEEMNNLLSGTGLKSTEYGIVDETTGTLADPRKIGMPGPEQNAGQNIATMPESSAMSRQESMRDKEHFEQNLVTSMVDAQGNPVDASRAGEDGVYKKFTHQGRNAPTGAVSRPDAQSVASVGFQDGTGGQVQKMAGKPARSVEEALDRALGRRKQDAKPSPRGQKGGKQKQDASPPGAENVGKSKKEKPPRVTRLASRDDTQYKGLSDLERRASSPLMENVLKGRSAIQAPEHISPAQYAMGMQSGLQGSDASVSTIDPGANIASSVSQIAGVSRQQADKLIQEALKANPDMSMAEILNFIRSKVSTL